MATLSLALIIAAMALIATPALAAKTHLYTGTSFGPDGAAGSANFKNLQSIAVDQANGNVFAYDAGNGGKVYKFSSSGAPVNFSALSGNVIKSVGGVGGDGGRGEFEIAVAPPGSPGGTAGDIYVANNSNSLRIFSATGESLGEIEIGEETCGVAVNPAGNVFVGTFPNGGKIREFTPSANPVSTGDETDASTVELGYVCNVAADGLGNVYGTNYQGNNLVRLEGLDDTTPENIVPGPTIAVDPATNDLYVNRRSLFAQYDSAASLIGTSGSGQLQDSHGIAVHGASGTVYAAHSPTGSGDNGKVDVFGPSVILASAANEPAIGVTSTKATLRGNVNPAGLAVTDCRFEYGKTTEYGESKPCEGTIPADEADHPVSVAITGLSPGSSYYFRIAATNANGTGRSEDSSFTTIQPAITANATAVTGSKATLNGAVLPEGETITECFFEYGIGRSFSSTVPCEGAIPADEGEHPVTAQLDHLTPNGTNYFFRLVINRAVGIARGIDLSFATGPTVITGAPTAVSVPNATLNGTLNPEGTPFTACFFEYGTSIAYGQSAPCAESPNEIGAGTSPVPVQTDIAGLAFGTTYHYRLAATNADGTVRGRDESFTTPGAVIEEQSVANVGQSEATLKATINSTGSPTTYHLEYGTDTSYGTATPESDVGSDAFGQTVTNTLRGLTVGTTYHYRFVATNSIGTTFGADRTFRTFAAGSEVQSCPNEAFRIGAGGRLPDCRAYEMVSPVEKNGIDIEPSLDLQLTYNRLEQASTSGDALTFATSQGIGEPEGVPYASQYLSSRTANGWQTRSLALRQGITPVDPRARVKKEYALFTPDLCFGVLQNFSETPLAPNAAASYPNLYENDLCGNGGVMGLTPEYREKLAPTFLNLFPPVIAGISNGGKCVTYYPTVTASPLPVGGEREGVVQMCGGTRHQVNIRPDGTPTDFGSVGYAQTEVEPLNNSIMKNAVSADGSVIYWTSSASGAGSLYVRVNASSGQSDLGPGSECLEPEKACTFSISNPIDTQNASFDAASADGSRMFFHFANGPFVGNLYEYDLAARSSRLIATGISASSGGTRPGGVVMGASDDGSKLYFASQSAIGGKGTVGAQNLYLYDADAGPEGEIRFIADISESTSSEYFLPISVPSSQVSRVTADGGHAVFATRARITDYDNRDVATGEPSFEVYVYDAAANGGAGKLNCVSCNPSGQRPNATRLLLRRQLSNVYAAGLIPTWETSFQAARAITNDGTKVFFEAFEALVPQDTNGRADVYQWTKEGAAGCSTQTPAYSPANGGCLSLISSGEGAADSRLVDATANGGDVYFATSQSLAVQDPGLIDIYDARVNGGFPPPPGLPPACEGEACQGPLRPPNDPTPSSSTYRGPGNEKQAKAKKKKSKKKSQQGKKKKKQSKGKKQRAGHNGRNGR